MSISSRRNSFSFWLYNVSRLPFAFTNLLQEKIFRRCIKGNYGSIVIADVDAYRTQDGLFVDCVREALDLIERIDPRRYGRIQKHIHLIANQPMVGWAEYRSWSKGCLIDFGRFKTESIREHREWYVALIAMLLVHEATHGYIFSLGFLYTAKSRPRHERLCVVEEHRFVRRLTSDRYDFARELIRPFDETLWEDNPWRRTQQLLARYRQ